ncbi:3-dehydrosphinganine reductase [Entomortierella parvispora]|uniref:3-dehydrosphinganine reductase n=1 Tax=Entomortierella parvispora TaxID=205924 RepID=A0A9P3H825_9FUNG|nr:3-dehydrosphinganine reductase [Entomortierella parvispora]
MVWSPADLLWSLTNRPQFTVFESICANLFLALVASLGITPAYNLIRGSQFNPKGKHVYLTGGSTGLGRAVAIDLAKQGAHVTIVARKEGPLKETVELMKQAAASRKDAPDQKFHWISADVTDKEQAARALGEAAANFGGRVPEVIITCAGISIPKLFIENEVEDFEVQMKLNYFGSLYTIHEGAKRMVSAGVKGKIVMVSSTMGLIGFAGYSSYSPTKFALRGLAESLRNEFLLYGISTHIYYAGTMFTPGYETENLTKPLVTRQIEGSHGLTPEEAAKGLMAGLRKGHFAVTTDFDTNFLRVAAKGVTPSANIGWDYVLSLVAPFAATQVLWEFNYKVKKFGKSLVKKEL